MNYKLISFILILSFLSVSCGKKEKEEAELIKEETKAVEGKVAVIIDYEKIETVKKQMAKLAPVEEA